MIVRMVHEILPFLIALIPALFWIAFCVPALFRLGGIAVPLIPWKRRELRLTANQSIFWEGIVSWGVSMLLFDLTDRYVRWRLYGRFEDYIDR